MNSIIISVMLLTNTFHFELAYTSYQRSMGMMYRTEWGDISGMLFIHDEPGTAHYWMKNTPLDMVMIFMDSDLKIRQIEYPVPYSTDIVSTTNNDIKYVLELDLELEQIFMNRYDEFQNGIKSNLQNYGFSFSQ